MVSVRRPQHYNPHKQPPKGKFSNSNNATFLTCRNLLLLYIAFQTFHIVFRSVHHPSSPQQQQQQQNAPQPKVAASAPLKSLRDALQDSKNKLVPKPPSRIATKDRPVGEALNIKRPRAAEELSPGAHEHIEKPNEEEQQQQLPPPPQEEDPEEPDHSKLDEQQAQGGEQANNAAAAADMPEEAVGAAAHDIVAKRIGTGPTAVGYVVDLLEERKPPANLVPETLAQLKDEIHEELHVAELSLKEQGISLQPCTYVDPGKANPLQLREICQDSETPLILYNSLPFDRTVCGKRIPAHEAVHMEHHTEDCADLRLAHVFPTDMAPVSGHGMPPMIVQTKIGTEYTAPDENLESIQCDIPCKYERGVVDNNNKQMYRYVAGTPWKIVSTWADPSKESAAAVEKTAFRKNVYYNTISFSAVVPLSHYQQERHSVRNKPALTFENAAPKATYIVNEKRRSDCESKSNRRHRWYAAVANVVPTDSYGICEHNKDPQEAGETADTVDGRVRLAQKNRIVLAFESASEKDYLTSITHEALLSGAVPVILGAPNLVRLLPTRSFIDAGKYNSWNKLAEDVKALANNKAEWESYHAWRQNPAEIDAYESRFNFTQTSAECRMCRWAYAKYYGLGWDHALQRVRDNAINKRKLCLVQQEGITDQKKEYLLYRPVWESWHLGDDNIASLKSKDTIEEEADVECNKGLTVESTIELKGYHFTRTIVLHDGVLDVTIAGAHEAEVEGSMTVPHDVVLRLHVPVRNAEGAYFRNSHSTIQSTRSALYASATVQDDKSIVTVLADFADATNIYSPSEGIINVVVVPAGKTMKVEETRRLRIVIEDVNKVHDKQTEYYPSSFLTTMTNDFMHPVSLFYVNHNNNQRR